MKENNKTRHMDDEQKILSVLQTNAHISIDVIAKKCGFSRQKVWRVIKKLEEQKTIWGYTAIYDEEQYDLKHFIMLMKLSTIPVDQKIKNEILTTRLDDLLPGSVIKIEHIEYVHGSYDGVFTFYAKDLVTAKRFCARFQERFNPFIASVEILEGIFFLRKQMLPNPKLKKQLSYL
jgi:DNA-binding Lrp family transcriptional regulator